MQGSSGDTDIENRLVDRVRGKERVGQVGRVAWKHTTRCKIDTQWECAAQLRNSNWGL